MHIKSNVAQYLVYFYLATVFDRLEIEFLILRSVADDGKPRRVAPTLKAFDIATVDL